MTRQAPLPRRQPHLPRPARWLLRLAPVQRETRAEVQADLHELFVGRRSDRGVVHAHWRLYLDVASLWLTPRPVVGTATSRYTLAPLRDATLALLRDARGDLRYAARLFARQPMILLLTIVGLSLGLGIATAAFSIMNAAVLRGEGVVDPDRAPGVLRTTDRSVATAWKYDEFLHLREGSTRMQVEAVLPDAAVIRMTAGAERGPSTPIGFVSGGFFTATGARVSLGRALEPADERFHGPPPVVVSYGFWSTRLHRDPAAAGRTIWIGRSPAMIVGVAARGFSVPNSRGLWMPLTAYGAVYDAAPAKRTPTMGVQVFGRLVAGAALADAEAQLSGAAAALAASDDSPLRVRLDTHAGLGRAPASQVLAVTTFVLAGIGLVLLLACANVATVLISTAITREREMGVRAALGASRWRIVRQLLTESVALGTIAASLGLGFAYWAVPLIGTMIEAPAGLDLAPDLNVYLFVAAAAVLVGVGAGLAPAWHGRGTDLLTPLKSNGSRQDRAAPRRLRSLLVLTQAAASLLLIVMSALFMRATIRAASIGVGFEAAGLHAVRPSLGRSALENAGAGIRAYWARALSDVAVIPGVSAVSLAEFAPFGDALKSASTGEGPSRRVTYFNRTQAGYFHTVGLSLRAGRVYTPAEVAADAPVAVVSESFARAHWPNGSLLGQLVRRSAPGSSSRPVVIGVVADAITARLHEQSALAVYEPLSPANEVFGHMMIRIAPGSSGVVEQVREQLRRIDSQAYVQITSVEAGLKQEIARPRVLAIVAGAVSAVAIVLCVIGLYGLTASVVGQRTREIGVRVAMGAERRDVLRLLMWDSLKPVIVGLLIGGGAAMLTAQLVAGTLFGVSPRDPLAFAGGAIILLAAATLAVLVPARSAASVDPAFVLRQS